VFEREVSLSVFDILQGICKGKTLAIPLVFVSRVQKWHYSFFRVVRSCLCESFCVWLSYSVYCDATAIFKVVNVAHRILLGVVFSCRHRLVLSWSPSFSLYFPLTLFHEATPRLPRITDRCLSITFVTFPLNFDFCYYLLV